MTRRDFELVARTVKAWPLIGKERMAQMFADTFEKAEGCSGFDRARFLKACGVTP